LQLAFVRREGIFQQTADARLIFAEDVTTPAVVTSIEIL
jgi:hypothetical protein